MKFPQIINRGSAIIAGVLIAAAILFDCTNSNGQKKPSKKSVKTSSNMSDKVVKTKEEWKRVLTPEQFNVTREHGTERAFTGAYHDHHEKGTYKCVCCSQDLFDSDTKFDSGTGWPSFYQPTSEAHVTEVTDKSFGSVRTEVLCSRCDAHLGHVFNDGPKPTGLRYCINSASLNFSKE